MGLLSIEKKYIKPLLSISLSKVAYPCFCTEEELAKVRKEQEEEKVTGYGN